MATHSSILTWEIPWTEDHGGLQSMRSQESHTAEVPHRFITVPSNHPFSLQPMSYFTADGLGPECPVALRICFPREWGWIFWDFRFFRLAASCLLFKKPPTPQGKVDSFLPQGWRRLLCHFFPTEKKSDENWTLKRICNLKQVPCIGLSWCPRT